MAMNFAEDISELSGDFVDLASPVIEDGKEEGNDCRSLSPRSKLPLLLDDIEDKVERFRQNALNMEEQRDFISSSIDALKTDISASNMEDDCKEDILWSIDKTALWFSSIELHVKTERNELQEESLNQVNTYIDSLVIDLNGGDPFLVKDRCVSYIAACNSKNEIFDKNFEMALLGCATDDQKRVQRRLQGLLNYIESSCKEPVVVHTTDIP